MDQQLGLVEKIVHEVKSQGVFDDFRKDSMSDVDTKPAYQNLRQRVDNSVNKFLQEQRWTPETNKNQLRERLRRHIAESGFLDVGVERIVDQVVNPKIGSVFQPRIEEIAYKCLGIPLPPIKYEPPPPPMMQQLHPLPPLPLNGSALKVETTSSFLLDLEQVSPDSDKATVKSECKEEDPESLDMDMDIEEKPDEDDESPPFEPLVKCDSPEFKQEPVDNETPNTDVEINAIESHMPHDPILPPGVELDTETQDTSISANTVEPDSEKETSRSLDAVGVLSQESQLSQVSSDSRISTASHDFTENGNGVATKSQSPKDAAVNISEEAQMPKFNENSSEVVNGGGQNASELHFDIKKDEIKFEGTERKSNLLPTDDVGQTHDVASSEAKEDIKEPNNSFQFANATGADSSFGSSLEDTCSAQLYIAEKTLDEPKTQSEPKSSAPVTPPNESTTAVSLPAPPPSQQRHSSSSSSRHKKHSKDKRRRSHEKDRPKSKESRDRHRSSSKHSTSNSSKHSSSAHKSSDAASKSEKSTVKHLTSSSSSSSRSEGSKRERSERSEADKEKRHTTSSSSASKELSVTFKKDERKSSIPNDDHNETKNKMNWRKSTDSNDEDKCPGSGAGTGSLPLKSPQSTTTASNAATNTNKTSSKSRSSTTESKLQNDSHEKEMPNASQSMAQHRNKVVLLNDILQNPTTDFIDLEAHTLHSNHVQVQIVSTVAADATIPHPKSDASTGSDQELLFFDELKGNEFTDRLKLLEAAMDGCRNAVNSLRFGRLDQSAAVDLYDEMAKGKEQLLPPGTKRSVKCPTQATLHVDCIQYSATNAGEQIDFEAEIDKTPRKRLRNTETKPSPTPSDNSVNSKENEIFDKNSVDAKSRRTNASNKYNQQQRYTSEDLYKPRPILSQRSRRRGVDTVI